MTSTVALGRADMTSMVLLRTEIAQAAAQATACAAAQTSFKTGMMLLRISRRKPATTSDA